MSCRFDVAQYVANYFSVSLSSLGPESGPVDGDVAGWDSFSHVLLILSLEDEISCRFSSVELETLSTIREIQEAVDRMLLS